MMNKKIKVQEITKQILAKMKEQAYADYTIGQYRHCYNGLQRYMDDVGIEYYSAEIGLDYIRHKFNIPIEGLYGKHPQNVRSTIRALQVLWDYAEYGTMVVKIRPRHKPFGCPMLFQKEYEGFCELCRIRKYTPMGKKSIFNILQKFLIYLEDSGVNNSEDLDMERILKFISSYSGSSTRYIATIVSILRNYLTFLYAEQYIKKDLTPALPKIKIMRGGFIPSAWKREDVHKLLETIDRNNPEGKRDYAILLTVTRLGLRASDIRSLKIGNINWSRKTISFIMQKTKQPLELPLLEDVGWALIDYLKNGRPQTKSDCVFVRHRAPYDGFADFNSFSRMIGRRMNKAGINMKGQKHGLHSMRSTLAKVMLENGAPLPVISEALGHQNIQTTSIYLKIDMEGLKNCILDPEELCHD